MKTTSTTWDDLNFGAIAAGRYRVVARAHRQAGASGYLALSEDGANAYQVTALTGEDYHLYDLGEFVADGVVHLHVLGKTDTGQVNLDWVCLFPVETAYVLYDCTDWHVDSWQIGDVCSLTGTGGNFVLMETAFPAVDLFNELLHRGVIVRPMQAYDLPNHIRVTLGKPEEMATFWNAAGPLLDGGC